MNELPIACTLTDAGLAARRDGPLKNLASIVQETRDLDSGFAFRLPADDVALAQAVEVIRLERNCCRFLRFELDVQPGGGPVWLALTGPEGTKEFLRDLLELTE